MNNKPTNGERGQAVKNLQDGTVIHLYRHRGSWVGEIWLPSREAGKPRGYAKLSSDTPIGLIADLALACQAKAVAT